MQSPLARVSRLDGDAGPRARGVTEYDVASLPAQKYGRIWRRRSQIISGYIGIKTIDC
jgi:hypothetical protein